MLDVDIRDSILDQDLFGHFRILPRRSLLIGDPDIIFALSNKVRLINRSTVLFLTENGGCLEIFSEFFEY
jgi:hypothetical protein